MSHSEYLCLVHDPFAQAWSLGDEVTSEKVALDAPEEEWTMVLDDEGLAWLHDGGEQDAMSADELLGYDLYKKIDGQFVKVWRDGRSPSYVEPPALAHQLLQAILRIGELKKEIRLQLAHFPFRQEHGHIRWDLLSLHPALELDAGKTPGRWVYDGIRAWCRSYYQCNLPCTMWRTSSALAPSTPAEDGLQRGRLKWPSVDTFGLLHHLARWSAAHRTTGGMKSEHDRLACRATLTSLIRTLEGRAWCMQLVVAFEPRFQWPWPPGCGRPLQLQVGRQGLADIPSLVALLHEGPEEDMKLLPPDLFQAGGGVSLVEFVTALVAQKDARHCTPKSSWVLAGISTSFTIAPQRRGQAQRMSSLLLSLSSWTVPAEAKSSGRCARM